MPNQSGMAPEGMFDAREGGRFRISLTYDDPQGVGKTDEQTDTFHGRFIELVPDTKAVQVIVFESDDPSMAGEMTITTTLGEAGEVLEGVHENLPPGIKPEDNLLGWQMSIDKLARLVETDTLSQREDGPLRRADRQVVVADTASSIPLDDGDATVAVALVGACRHDQGQDQTDRPNDHQDQANGVDVEALGLNTHRPIEDGSKSHQKQASANSASSHRFIPFAAVELGLPRRETGQTPLVAQDSAI